MQPDDRWQEIYDSYAAEWDTWDALATHVRGRLETTLRELQLYGWVFARAKDAESFTRKVIIGERNPESIGDRAGVRVVLAYESQCKLVEDAVRREFTLISREQKRDALAYDQNGYLGVHLEIRLRDDDPQRPRFGERRVELQLRTIGQWAWAEVSHEQLYKPAIDVPEELKRRIYRLVSLVELFDNEVAGFVAEAQALPGYREAAVLPPLESELRTRFGVLASPDRRISRELAAALVPLYEPTNAQQVYEEILRPWIAEHEDDLRVQLERGERERHPLIRQPEILLLFERIDRAPAALEEAWPDTLPRVLLARLGQLWGREFDL
jgi:ppGpp synthetase/RelA/SpoT-type nucleotidyltranferase